MFIIMEPLIVKISLNSLKGKMKKIKTFLCRRTQQSNTDSSGLKGKKKLEKIQRNLGYREAILVS